MHARRAVIGPRTERTDPVVGTCRGNVRFKTQTDRVRASLSPDAITQRGHVQHQTQTDRVKAAWSPDSKPQRRQVQAHTRKLHKVNPVPGTGFTLYLAVLEFLSLGSTPLAPKLFGSCVARGRPE